MSLKSPALGSLAWRFYVRARRAAQTVLRHSPALERLVGRPLRRLEQQIRPYDRLRPVSEGGTIGVHGFTLRYRPVDGGVVNSLLLNGDYEGATGSVIARLLEPGATFVDLGAHIGYFSLLAARSVAPSGRVYAFEAVPATREVLEENVRANQLDQIVHVAAFAVWETSGTVPLRLEANSSVSCRISDESVSAGRSGTVEVPATSLDDFFRAEGWPSVHLVKMDIEGAELPALRGMRELCSRNPLLGVIIELNLPHLERQGTTGEQFFDALRALGFDRFSPLLDHGGETEAEPGTILEWSRHTTVNLLCRRQ